MHLINTLVQSTLSILFVYQGAVATKEAVSPSIDVGSSAVTALYIQLNTPKREEEKKTKTENSEKKRKKQMEEKRGKEE